MLIVSKFFLRIFEFSNHFPCSVGVSRGVAVMELTAKLTIRNESSADFFIFFLQWCHGGSLFDLIHRSPHELPKEHKLRLATGAAAGGIVFFTTTLLCFTSILLLLLCHYSTTMSLLRYYYCTAATFPVSLSVSFVDVISPTDMICLYYLFTTTLLHYIYV